MENQDKIFEQFRQSVKKAEDNGFERVEAVWSRVEEKLDRRKDRRFTGWWKYAGVAAILVLFVTLGTFLLDNKQPQVLPQVQPENNVTLIDTQKANEVVVPKEVANEAVAVEQLQKNKDNKAQQPTHLAPSKIYPADDARILSAQSDVAAEAGSPIQAEAYTNGNGPGTDDALIKAPAAAIDVITKKVTDNSTAFVDGTYTGTVVDPAGMPIPGVDVRVRGSHSVALTDFDGRFKIAAQPGDVLEVSFIGMQQQSLTAGAEKNLSIAMQNDMGLLQDVVIETYRTPIKARSQVAAATTSISVDMKTARKAERDEKKRAKEALAASPMTNSAGNMAMASMGNNNVTTVASNRYPSNGSLQLRNDDKNAKENASMAQTLQGQVPGLTIATGNGQPGAPGAVALRGTGSTNGEAGPLYIIDGKPTNAAVFKLLAPSNIKSIQVLRYDAATALYGNLAYEGAIIVTTQGLTRKQKKELKRAARKTAFNYLNILPQTPLPQTQEDYESFVENPFENPALAPLSTFSIDVDNASYTNIRRFLNNGQAVPKDAVRVEEMVNFFKYNYPQPKGDELFSINTEYSDAPWNPKHKLLKIGLQGKNIPTDRLPASNFVFLIDVSGSMDEPGKLPLLKQSMKLLLSQMRKEDKVAIVVYAGAAGMALPPTPGDKKETILSAFDNLKAGGSTAGGQGIELAYKIAAENFIKGGNNRVILATDGDFNVGMTSNKDMQALIEDQRKTGVFLTCLGFGMGNYKDSKLETLSDKGNGNYAYIDNMQEANRFLQKEFAGSMYAIAKDVKIQIEFNPIHVKAYRLIGYENRKLRDEDFANDAIDAGELGSGHTVTALYEIIPAGVESSYFTTAPGLKYTSTPPSTVYNNELATIKFRYKKPDEDKSKETVYIIPNVAVALPQASADLKFAAAVAWFGLKLRDSQLIPDKATAHIVQLASEGATNDPDGYRTEFIRLAGIVE